MFKIYRIKKPNHSLYKIGLLTVCICPDIRSLDISFGVGLKNHAQTRIFVEKNVYLCNKGINVEKPTICAFLTLALFHARVKFYYKPDNFDIKR